MSSRAALVSHAPSAWYSRIWPAITRTSEATAWEPHPRSVDTPSTVRTALNKICSDRTSSDISGSTTRNRRPVRRSRTTSDQPGTTDSMRRRLCGLLAAVTMNLCSKSLTPDDADANQVTPSDAVGQPSGTWYPSSSSGSRQSGTQTNANHRSKAGSALRLLSGDVLDMRNRRSASVNRSSPHVFARIGRFEA